MNRYLLVLCGIPASGKTTLAMKLQELLATKGEIRLVSTDRWRDRAYYEDFTPEKENEVREQAIEETRDYLAQGFSVIHDDTNYYASMRHELYILAMENEYSFGIIHIETPLEIAMEWNKQRENPLSEDIIMKIHERFDIPGSRYSWDNPIDHVDLSKIDLNLVVPQLVKKLDKLQPLEFPKKAIPGYAEFYDKLTRQIVNAFLKDAEEMRENPEVSNLRKEVLKEAIAGNMTSDQVRQLLLTKLENLG
ncbi:MAG: AAA family ATPase [Candidatus Thorarchaeota archaeon]